MPTELGRTIREARGNASPEEFAARLGCSYQTLYRWERGSHAPRSRAHINALVAAGVPADLVVGDSSAGENLGPEAA